MKFHKITQKIDEIGEWWKFYVSQKFLYKKKNPEWIAFTKENISI